MRLSSADALILVAASAIAWWMHRAGNDMWWMVAAVVGHFFLFCNVFRIRRSLELGWAAVFVANVGWWLSRDCTGWLPAMQYQAPVTVVVILIEMFSPSYHGIGARCINRRLPGYLNDEIKFKK
jgi:hypothetical protein